MSPPAPPAPSRPADPHPGSLLGRVRAVRPLWVIVAVQSVWATWMFGRGWFLQADLSNLTEGLGRRPDWGYLTEQLGGHFAPVARLVFWALATTDPLDYGAAVLLRVACLALSTVLLHRLLTRLVGDRPLVLVVVAVYALNPMLLGGLAQFTPGITIGIGQVFLLLALLSHVRHEQTGRLRPAVASGLLLALAVLSSEQWAVAAAVLPLLSLVHFYPGTLRSRLVELVRRWRTWVLLLLPVAVAGVGVLAFADPVGAANPSLSASYRLLRNSWLYSLGPSWIGGPLRWYPDGSSYISTAAPSDLVVVLGQVAVAVTVLLGVQRNGVRSLAAWLLPVSFWVPSMLLIGYRGFDQLNVLIAITPRYVAALMSLWAIGVVLALAPDGVAPRRATVPAGAAELPDPAVGARADATDEDATNEDATDAAFPRAARHRLPRGVAGRGALAAVLVAASVAAGLVSSARFADVFSRLPAQRYVDNLTASARLAGTATPANVYDTSVPAWLISSVEPHHRVTDLLGLAGVPVTVNGPTSTPLVAAADGRLVPSVFVPAASVAGVRPCGTPLRGAGTFTYPLSERPRRGEWYLRLRLFQQRPSTIRLTVVDASGAEVAPVTGPTLRLPALAEVSVRLPAVTPTAVRIRSADPAASTCFTTVQVGAPFPRPGS